jgi:hypothetical protein
MRTLLVAALAVAVAVAAATARTTTAAAPPAVRLDCGTRVLALVFLPGKRLVDVGDASHRRLLVADAGDVVWLKTCRRSSGRLVTWGSARHASTITQTRLGCVFPSRVQLVVERAHGIQVLAALPGSRRALLRAVLAQGPRLEYDRRYCRAL